MRADCHDTPLCFLTNAVNRIGQIKEVKVFRLVAQGTIEEKVLQIQARKTALMNTVRSAVRGPSLNSHNPGPFRDEGKRKHP